MNMPLWIYLISVSLIIGVGAFLWGLLTGQFAQSERARFLPFAGEENSAPEAIRMKSKTPLEVYVLAAISLAGLVIFAAPVVLTVYHLLTR